MRISTLPINPDAGFPQQFECRVAGTLLRFIVRHNGEGDFYTVDILDSDDAPIAYGKPIVYGSDLFDGIVDDRLPDVVVLPVDMADAHQSVGAGNLGTDVQMLILEPAP